MNEIFTHAAIDESESLEASIKQCSSNTVGVHY